MTFVTVSKLFCFLDLQCTEVRFASFLSGGFITAIVVNPLERKLAKRTSVHWSFDNLGSHPPKTFFHLVWLFCSPRASRHHCMRGLFLAKGILMCWRNPEYPLIRVPQPYPSKCGVFLLDAITFPFFTIS